MKLLSGEEREMLERVAELGPGSVARDATPREDQLLFGLLLAGRIEAVRSFEGGKRKPRVTTMGRRALTVDRATRSLLAREGSK